MNNMMEKCSNLVDTCKLHTHADCTCTFCEQFDGTCSSMGVCTKKGCYGHCTTPRDVRECCTRDVKRDRQNAPQNSLLLGDLRHLLVDDVDAEPVAGALELGDDVADGLDALHLLVEVVALQEVAEVGVALLPRLPVQVQQRLVHRLLEPEGGLHGLEGAAPLHG